MKFLKRYFFIPIILVVFLFFFFFVYQEVKDKTIDQFNKEQQLIAKSASQGIQDYVSGLEADLHLLSMLPEIIDFKNGGKELSQKFFESRSTQIEAVTRTDANGIIMYTFPENEDVIGMNISYQEHFNELMKEQRPVISDVFTAVQGYLSIAVHVPIYKNKQFQGSLAVLIAIDKIGKRYLGNMRKGEAGYALLLSEDNIEIYCPFHNHIGKSIKLNQNEPAVFKLIEHIKQHNAGHFIYSQASSEKQNTTKNLINYYRIPLGNTYWTILILTPQKTAVETIAGFRNRFVILFVVFFLILLVYSYFLIKSGKILKEENKRKKVERALRESEEKYRNLFEESADGILVLDERNQIIELNKRICQLLGYTRDELHGMNMSSLIHPEDKANQNHGDAMSELLNGKTIGRTDKLIKKNGSEVPIELSAKMIGEGRFLNICRDITERIQNEKERNQSNERFKSVFKDSPVSLWEEDYSQLFLYLNSLKDRGITDIRAYLDANDEDLIACINKIKVIDINTATLELHQAKDKEELISNLDKTFTRSSILVFKEIVIAIAENRSEFEAQTELMTIKGETRQINLKLKIDRSDLSYKRALLAIIDITKQKLVEESIQQKSKNLSTLLEISQTLSSTLNKSLVLQSIIDEACKLIGLDTGAIYLIDGSEICLGAANPPVPQEYPAEFRHALLKDHPHIEQCISTGLPISIVDLDTANLSPAEQVIKESRHMRSLLYVPLQIENKSIGVLIMGTQSATREYSDLEINLYRTISGQAAMAIYNSQLYEKIKNLNEGLEQHVAERTQELSNSQVALLNLVEDLNEKSKQLEISSKKLQAKNKELETFTYSVSHDLKAPLRGIDGYSKILQDTYQEILDDEATIFLRNIRDSALKMNQLIDDLLEYSRLERSDMRIEKVNIKDLVSSTLSIYKAELEESKFRVIINVTGPVIPTDYKGLTIALRNLIEDAIKFTKGREHPSIELLLEEQAAHWLLSVRDNGIGFDMKYGHKIFDIFQRLHRVEDYPGTGIGLAKVEKAVRRMNGQVYAESTLDKGSIFYFKLPKNTMVNDS